MPLAPEVKQDIIKKFAREEGDTGSPEVQIAVLTERIKQVAAHLRENRGDKHNRRGLVMMVSKRNRLLRYLRRTDVERYRATIQALGLRK
jgi:small subunit ribosomal protein S15